MALPDNPYEYPFTGYSGLFGASLVESDTIQDRKYSWVAGLAKCPKCNSEDLESENFYCDDCGYGKEGSRKKRPPAISGYKYVVDKDNKHGKYFRVSDKRLFATVVLEPYKKQMIVDALSMIENRKTIFQDWGFAETIEKGIGVSMLFHGLPGTGKTLMAQAVADYLGKELKIVTAAEVLSKWVGESEKTIAKLFDQHKDSVILFDECDSLLSSRESARASWEVSQVNVLLNKLENHEGVSIFTTNHTANLDKALDRRIAAKIRFDMPSQDLRVEIWKRMFPKKAPLAKDIDWNLLASYEVTGGYVKNTVLRAARIAASRGDQQITFAVLKESLRQELETLMEYAHSESIHTETVPEKSIEKEQPWKPQE